MLLSRHKALLGAGIAVTILLRLPFLGIPFYIGDEAQLITFGAQIVHDHAVYGIGVIDFRGPGGYLFYALIVALFGFENTLAAHIVGIIMQLLSLLLVAILAASMFEKKVATLSALLYSVFSFSYILHHCCPIITQIDSSA